MARTIGEGLVRIRPDTSGFGREAERGLTSAMQRTVGRLEGVLSRLAPIAARLGQDVGRRFAGGVERETNRLRPALANLFRVGGAVVLGGGIAYVAAQAMALTSAVVPAIGAIGLLPGVAVTAAAGLGVLALATRGLGAALAESTGGGGGGGGARAAAAAYEAMQRRIASAQRDATRAARDLIDARREESERLQQLAMDLKGAGLAVERATLAEEAAAEALEEATKSRDPDAIREADLAHRESAHTLQEVTARHAELAAEQDHANRVGVNGSRTVQDALERQRDAQAELTAAKKETTSAGVGAAGAVSAQAAAYAKLAPSAQALVRTLRALKPAWDGMARSVQERVWAGVAGHVQGLSDRYLPVLTARFGGIGVAVNRAVRETARLAMSKAFVADVDTGLRHAAATSDTLARAVAPIVSGLRHIGVEGMAQLPRLADWVLQLARRFEAWTARARESGQLGRWMANGVAVLRQLGAIAGNVVGIITALVRAGGGEAGGDMLSGLEAGTARLRAFLNSAEGQERISQVLSTVRDVVNAVVASLPALTAGAQQLGPALAQAAGEGGALRDGLSVTGVVIGFVADHLDTLVTLLPWLAAGYVLVKGAQTAANLASVVMLPLKAAEVASNWGLRASMQAHTTALAANTAATRGATIAQGAETAATNGGILAKGRNVAVTIGQRIATIAGTAATWLATAATAAFGIALQVATGPIGLIILAVALLVAGIILLWKKNETFRTIVIGTWNAIKAASVAVFDFLKAYFLFVFNIYKTIFTTLVDAAKFVWDKASGYFRRLVDFIGGIGSTVKSRAKGMWDGIVTSARGAINKVIDIWNRLDFGINIRVPDWVPGVGGKGFSVPDLFPDIPRLADGGVARARPGGILANIGEGGEDEAVAPLSTLAAMIADAVRDGGGGRGFNVEKLIIKAFTDRFSVRQVQEELAMLGAH